MSGRSTPAFAIGGIVPEFRCICCGAETGTMPVGAVRAICCACAGEHPEYEGGYCVECGAEREYPSYDDDVGFGGFGYQPGELTGIPASAMNGNAMKAGSDAWYRWVAFCNACGHP